MLGRSIVAAAALALMASIGTSAGAAAMPMAVQLGAAGGPADIVSKTGLVCADWGCYRYPGDWGWYRPDPFWSAWRRHYWSGWQPQLWRGPHRHH